MRRTCLGFAVAPDRRGARLRYCLVSAAFAACVGFGGAASAQQTASSPLPPVVPANRPIIGLALEGGGALGLAHIGVLEWFDEHHVPIDRISGTSMGALVGAFYASGKSMKDLEKLATGNVFDSMFSIEPPYTRLGYRRRQDRSDMPQAISLGLRGGRVSIGNALIADDSLDTLLGDELVSYNSENLDFNLLPVPFRCVATDLTTLEPKVFRSGGLAVAVRSSIAIPGIFRPIRFEGHVLVDGAIVDNLPVDVLRDDLGAQVLIGVHLKDAAFATTDAGSLTGVFGRAYQAGTARNELISEREAQIVLMPDVEKFSSAEYGKGHALIAAGYKAAEDQKAALLQYALSDEDWKSYLEVRASRARSRPGMIHTVTIEGASAVTASVAPSVKHELTDKPFDEKKLDRIITDLRSSGGSAAFYETFSEEQAGNPPPTAHAPDNAVSIHLRPNLEGPPYLLLGADVVAMSGNVTSSVFDLRFIDQDLGGYGSELRSTVRLGYFTHAQAEFYKPVFRSRFFVQPRLSIVRDPVYLWEDQKRVSERFLQRAGGGLDVGFAFNPRFQIALTYDDNQVRWKLVDGNDLSPTQHLSGNAQTGGLHLSFSNQVAAVVSPSGTSVDAFVGALFHTAMSPDTPMASLRARHAWMVSHRNAISLSGQADTYFRAAVADPFRFTLGGPLRLYASSIDEYRGTDTALGRLVFLHKVATLPTGIGDGVYLTGGYEAGNLWSHTSPALLRQDGFGGLLFSTPLGALTLGGAVGDAGHRKAFFTFGHLF